MWAMELLLLLVSALGALGSALHGSVEESPDVQSLPGRMGRVERLLQRQTLALSRQENLILRLQSQLAQQEVTLTRQEMLLSGYAHVFAQLNAGLRSEEKSRLLEDAILQQTPGAWNGFLNRTSQKSTDQPSSQTADDVNSARTAAARHVASHSDDVTRARNAEARDVMARSDDAGPLEAVVNRVSQQVTEMGAELQAFKTQTAADIRTVKTQTAADIHTLQTQTAADIHTLQTQATHQSLDLQDARTSSFVHWGSASCGDGNASQLVYSGVVGGSRYSESGGASNHLCLTLSPVAGDDKTSAGAHLYGAEYETGDAHQDKDPVCSVCRASFATTVMIPGTNVCAAGWTKQYTGYLMAGAYDDIAASEFICVDSRLESRIGGDQDINGKSLFYTTAVCGSLPCQPYVNGKTVTCVVCSK